MFPFSPRQGTPAADMRDQISRALKSERGKILSEVESELKRDYLSSLVGRQVQMLVEKNEEGTACGTSCRYVPVRCETEAVENELVTVDVERVQDGFLIGNAA